MGNKEYSNANKEAVDNMPALPGFSVVLRMDSDLCCFPYNHASFQACRVIRVTVQPVCSYTFSWFHVFTNKTKQWNWHVYVYQNQIQAMLSPSHVVDWLNIEVFPWNNCFKKGHQQGKEQTNAPTERVPSRLGVSSPSLCPLIGRGWNGMGMRICWRSGWYRIMITQ